MTWRNSSCELASLGSQSAKATSMGDLHRRRAESQGQFFTPEWVSRGLWASLRGVVGKRDHLHVMDSSVGSAALLAHAPVEKCTLYGVDVDGRCLDAISADANEAGIAHEFRLGGMESLEARNMDICVINPPYTITLSAPTLFPYECTHFGKYGPGTSALSHEYAIDQALDIGNVTAAVLPYSMLGYCKAKVSDADCSCPQPSLRMVVRLPDDCFTSESANVKTAVFFFAAGNGPVVETQINGPDCQWPVLDVHRKYLTRKGRPFFTMNGVDILEKIITRPVTGNARVDLHHHGRRIVLRYHCAGTQARVENGLLVKPVVGERMPRSIRYSGDGKLLIDVMLLQDDPGVQLEKLCDEITCHGGEPVVSETLAGFYRKLLKRHRRAITPMHRTVQGGGDSAVKITAKRRMMLDPSDFNSPGVAKGEVVDCRLEGGLYVLSKEGCTSTLRADEISARYELEQDHDDGSSWRVLHEGLWKEFPVLADMHMKRMMAMGVDQWLAEFQVNSVIEGLVRPYGYIAAHEQGSGKTRSGIALCLLHSGCNMFVVEAGLMPELMREIKQLQIPGHLWKRVAKNDDVPDAKLNIVSYGDLRYKAKNTAGKNITNADRWRRKVNFMICDEGGLLANGNTQQSIAIRRLAARKVCISDGTPMRNYTRNMLPLCVATAGNGVAHQTYGVRGKPFLEKRMIRSCDHVVRGEDQFFDDYVETVWVTNMFRHDLVTGAKREVPRVKNLQKFWRWIAPNMQRRVRSEPALAIFNNCPDPNITIHTIEWDREHFDHYMMVAEDFAHWYLERQDNDGQHLNLITVLARVGAVLRAANSPHVESALSMGVYCNITSKQRYLLERIKYWKDAGRKVVVYASCPDVQLRMSQLLMTMHGIESVLYTGEQNIKSRTRELDKKFLCGDADVLLASMVGSRGLNMSSASIVLHYDRLWSAAAEQQCLYRVLRPAQTQQVEREMFHLEGGIDEYCAQLVEWKSKAASAGLDFGVQCGDDEEFIHMDTILRQFADDVLGRDNAYSSKGSKGSKGREAA